ncbi:MAG: TraM recognition domain-containing protein, partial [bacterium]
SPGIVVPDLLAQRGILYVGLAADQYPSAYKRVSTLLLMDLQACLTRRYRDARAPACFVYLDEFADLLYPQMRALIAKAREARVGITVAHQSLGDLEHQARGLAESLFEDTGNKVLFRQGSADSAQELARLSGTSQGDAMRWSPARRGLEGRFRARSLDASAMGRDYLFDPNALLNLAVGEAFLVIQNRSGRELYRACLPVAPAWESAEGSLHQPRPGRAFRPLVLPDLDSLDAPPQREPTTAKARAALERLRGPKRGV